MLQILSITELRDSNALATAPLVDRARATSQARKSVEPTFVEKDLDTPPTAVGGISHSR